MHEKDRRQLAQDANVIPLDEYRQLPFRRFRRSKVRAETFLADPDGHTYDKVNEPHVSSENPPLLSEADEQEMRDADCAMLKMMEITGISAVPGAQNLVKFGVGALKRAIKLSKKVIP